MRNNPHILLLQGPASMFFAAVGAEFRQYGAQVTRLTFCPADHLYWRKKSGRRVAYRDRPEDFPPWIKKFIAQEKVTDIICLGDGRFWHESTVKACKSMGSPPNIHIVEHGYYRPGWLVLERNGINANSSFPRDPAEISKIAAQTPPLKNPRYQSSFLRYAALDIGWNLANILLAPLFYPHYKTHALDHPFVEWSGWIKKAVFAPATAKKTKASLAKINRHSGPQFLFPLQLATDYQIRAHGPKDGLIATVSTTVESFAGQAPLDAMLIFKIHPLDNARIDWAQKIAEMAEKHSCTGRIVFLHNGDLNRLLQRCSGCITVNSTVGLTAIELGIATHVIGRAIYTINGLTDPQPLDSFWQNPTPPDQKLAQEFKTALIAKTQISGAFDGSGVKPGSANIVARVLGG